MNLILGFGPNHTEKGRKIADAVSDSIVDILKKNEISSYNDIKPFFNEIAQSHGKYIYSKSNKEYDIVYFCFPSIESSTWKNIIVEFHVSHYRDDHPLSPDGFACLTQKFVFSASYRAKSDFDDEWMVKWCLTEGGLTEEA